MTTILNLTRLLTVIAVLVVSSAAANIYQYYRRPIELWLTVLRAGPFD